MRTSFGPVAAEINDTGFDTLVNPDWQSLLDRQTAIEARLTAIEDTLKRQPSPVLYCPVCGWQGFVGVPVEPVCPRCQERSLAVKVTR